MPRGPEGPTNCEYVSGVTMLHGPVRPLAHDSVVSAIARLATSRSDLVAIEDGGRLLTFGDFWNRALGMAARLREAGVGPGDRVALWADRTTDIITAAFSIMLCRAAYVPVDPAYPERRIRAIVDGASPILVMYDGRRNGPPPAVGLTTVDTATLDLSAPRRAPALPDPGDIAYVIFTSGSTGAPKGVMIDHRALLNYSAWCAATLGGTGVGTPLFGSLGFDAVITVLWPTLLAGDRVTVCAGVWDQETLVGPRPRPYSLMKVTPSHLRFIDKTARPTYSSLVRTIVIGGEVLDPSLIAAFGDRVAGVRLVNHYGPTEATVGSLYHEFTSQALPSLPSVPIGSPIWNTRCYLVDENLRAARGREPAELVIAGPGVAAGYLSQVGQCDRFVDEAELGGPTGRAYRTGDRVELLPDGTVLYLGREDGQLKVGGHRVELGELRQHALAVTGVREVAFDVVRDWIDRVEAFVVADGSVGDELLAEAVREAMTRFLPSAVVPRRVFVVPELAINVHGKFDVAAMRAQMRARAP